MKDLDSGDTIDFGDSTVCNYGMYMAGYGQFELTGPQDSTCDKPVVYATNGRSVGDYKVIRATIDGDSLTVQRGDTANSFDETLSRTMKKGIAGKRFTFEMVAASLPYFYIKADWLRISFK